MQKFISISSHPSIASVGENIDGVLEVYEHFDDLEEHSQTLSGEKHLYLAAICKICNQRLPNESDLNKHMEGHLSDQPIVCDKCSMRFKTHSQYQQHCALHTKKDSHTCDVCYKSYSTKASLKIHYRSHTGFKVFMCNLCHRSFNFMCRLKMHHQKMHVEYSLHACSICSEMFPDANLLNEHVLSHKLNLHTCDVCNKSFSTERILTCHKKTHTSLKSFVCNICYQSFTTPASLKRHFLIHAEDSPYSCSLCNHLFLDADSLEEHKQTHPEPKTVCDICNRKFNSPRGLKRHYYIHSGENHFKCSKCPTGFRTHIRLERHKREHHPKKCLVGATIKVKPSDTKTASTNQKYCHKAHIYGTSAMICSKVPFYSKISSTSSKNYKIFQHKNSFSAI